MKLIITLGDASLYNLEQIAKRIKLIEGVSDVVGVIGNETVRFPVLLSPMSTSPTAKTTGNRGEKASKVKK